MPKGRATQQLEIAEYLYVRGFTVETVADIVRLSKGYVCLRLEREKRNLYRSKLLNLKTAEVQVHPKTTFEYLYARGISLKTIAFFYGLEEWKTSDIDTSVKAFYQKSVLALVQEELNAIFASRNGGSSYSPPLSARAVPRSTV